jgi:hypothetical protein
MSPSWGNGRFALFLMGDDELHRLSLEGKPRVRLLASAELLECDLARARLFQEIPPPARVGPTC